MKTNGYFGALMIINDLGRGIREELIIVAAVSAQEGIFLFKISLISDITSIVSRGEIRQSITLH